MSQREWADVLASAVSTEVTMAGAVECLPYTASILIVFEGHVN